MATAAAPLQAVRAVMHRRRVLHEVTDRIRADYAWAIGRHRTEVVTPSLVLDLGAAQRNIDRMAAELAGLPAGIRPHYKAHKSPELAWRQLRAGAFGMATATIWEALALAEAGIDDIFLVNQIADPDKVELAADLARSTTFRLAIDSATNVRMVSAAAVHAGSTVGVMLEVDTGMGRSGTTSTSEAVRLAHEVAALPGLRLDGITGYEGQCSLLPDDGERRAAQAEAMERFMDVADAIVQSGLDLAILSAGGTATWRWTAGHGRITEIQAGTYVLMDTEYASMNPGFEHALTVEATVISRAGARVILDAGSKSLADGMHAAIVPRPLSVVRVDEEHGIFDGSTVPDLAVGDRVAIIPGYAPGTVNLFDAYLVVQDEIVVEVWPIVPRGQGSFAVRASSEVVTG